MRPQLAPRLLPTKRSSSASISTAATTASTRSCRCRRPSTRVTSRSARTSPACSARPAVGSVGTTVMGGTGGTLAFANPLVSGTGNNGASGGLDTLYGDGSGGVGLRSRDLPGGRLSAGQPVALREPRLLVCRRARGDADRLARALARPLRLDEQPAAGGLDRHCAVQVDPQRDRAGLRDQQPHRHQLPALR